MYPILSPLCIRNFNVIIYYINKIYSHVDDIMKVRFSQLYFENPKPESLDIYMENTIVTKM